MHVTSEHHDSPRRKCPEPACYQETVSGGVPLPCSAFFVIRKGEGWAKEHRQGVRPSFDALGSPSRALTPTSRSVPCGWQDGLPNSHPSPYPDLCHRWKQLHVSSRERRGVTGKLFIVDGVLSFG